jgi:heme oxygenase (biliverdin-producing, ferredoxin)|uniref:heme oxygenase n=1 Tax=Cryptomonas gyropyrenoidosa TaxID=233257 RepID=UPI00279C6629|nr:heme oxygenase [Cryptomonas gyropyrenoidosa]WFQ82984.1 heme oxygenase [Cryptomonas gyropyrenoidosa]
MTISLATQLREGTSKSHSMAENVSFVKSFLGGVIDKNSYRKLVSNLYFVYVAMEEEMEKHKTHEVIKPIFFPELNRKISLEKDLEYYFGPNWRSSISLSEATKLYVDRIRTISAQKPELLIAHAYTRYLGDLSGGQLLKKIAQRAMNLPNEQGLSFYNFDDIDDEQAFKQHYKKALNSLPLSADLINQIIAEANVSFTLNMKMFQELETSFIRIILKLLTNNVLSSLNLNPAKN